MARQFNQVYSNWYETKKNEKKYRGKTPRYILDRFGLETDNLDVTVRLDFRIKGTLNRVNSTYRWEVKMIIKFGKKLQDEYTIQGGLRDTKEILTTKEVNFELDRPYTEFDNKYTVLDNVSIKQGLIEAFDDIKNQVQSLKPSYMLGAATSTRLDLPEGKIENLINKIIQEIKK